jgi:hypothetical protein
MSERSQAHAAQARADLARAVAALRDSDAWRRNLAVMAQFPTYRFHAHGERSSILGVWPACRPANYSQPIRLKTKNSIVPTTAIRPRAKG